MRVLNKYRDKPTPGCINIMRPGPLGNQFYAAKLGRDVAVDRHLVWLRKKVEDDPEYRAKIKALKGHDLLCCCAPRRCHGDNYVIVCEELNSDAL